MFLYVVLLFYEALKPAERQEKGVVFTFGLFVILPSHMLPDSCSVQVWREPWEPSDLFCWLHCLLKSVPVLEQWLWTILWWMSKGHNCRISAAPVAQHCCRYWSMFSAGPFLRMEMFFDLILQRKVKLEGNQRLSDKNEFHGGTQRRSLMTEGGQWWHS